VSAPIELLREASGIDRPRVLVVHAHPDDETVQTGGLMASLAHDTDLVLLTCTRGEAGERRPGVLPHDVTDEQFARAREDELQRACVALGITEHHFLGTAPARVAGAGTRKYRDSGMRWIREGLAGPDDGDDPRTFTAGDLADEADDLLALIAATRPHVVIGYDEAGSYGHPDHVRAHHLARAATDRAGLPLVEVASGDDADGFTWFSLGQTRDAVIDALGAHATQVGVVDGEIVHVGGQHQALPLSAGLRRVR
jgi:N-acetyl-1-D-myo-inositol-2-amino-2-deoxy-alpha-D-glucopyranoside deacetylase